MLRQTTCKQPLHRPIESENLFASEPEQTFDTKGMRPGKPYIHSKPGKMREMGSTFTEEGRVYSLGEIGGFGHETVPSRVLHWNLAFSKCEPGNIVPRRYLSEVVEPKSHDPENHPVPTLWWWHKFMPNERPVSYHTDASLIDSEGKDRDPYEHFRNPRHGPIRAHVNQWVQARRKLSPMGKLQTAWWKKGRRRLADMRKGRDPHMKRQSSNPWWVRMLHTQFKLEGREDVTGHASPHWTYYKFLPILGWNGFGTRKGEINVDMLYKPVGLDQIQWWVDTGLLNTNEVITPNTLVENRLIDDYHWPGVKIVTGGCTWFNAQIDIEVENIEDEAAAEIRKHGGSVTTRWRDEEGVTKEKFPWRFPVIGGGKLPPEELIRDVYTNEAKGGYLTAEFYQNKLRANPENSREWSLLSKTPEEIGEIPPEPEVQTARPIERRPEQVSLQKKQAYWEDYLDNKANTPGSRLGVMTPSPFSLWEYTYTHKAGPGHQLKRDPPAGMEHVVYPGYPFRDSRYYMFMKDARTRMKKSEAEETDPYSTTEMETVTVKKQMAWELKGEGWRTKEDREIKYRNPYKNPYLKERIEAWQAEQKRKKKMQKEGKK